MKRLFFVALGFTLLFASCVKKPDEVPTGEAKVRFVNAASGTEAQDMYINGGRFLTQSITYRNFTPYLGYNSGFNFFAFTNTNTEVVNSGVDYASAIDSYTTIFQYRNLNKAIIADPIPDDMTLPPNGKARVRFIHLNHFLNNYMRVTAVGGAEIVPALSFRSASKYFDIDPGTKFIASGTGITNAPEVNINAVAGKIYTVWFSGETEMELIPNLLIQN
ncbi:MAG: DUF4397 domain-containing protein [Pedobacter sp.]|nr:MAG: DUF4397 domain-containing protein [Pedobacter sp.]